MAPEQLADVLSIIQMDPIKVRIIPVLKDERRRGRNACYGISHIQDQSHPFSLVQKQELACILSIDARYESRSACTSSRTERFERRSDMPLLSHTDDYSSGAETRSFLASLKFVPNSAFIFESSLPLLSSTLVFLPFTHKPMHTFLSARSNT